MTLIGNSVKEYFRAWISGWDRFWFAPSDPLLLGVIRILAGLVIFYTHLAWTIELNIFFGSKSVVPKSYRHDLVDGTSFFWSHFDWLPNDNWILPVHLIGLLIMALFVIGYRTRWTGIATALLVISYANRTTGVQFGLDQVNSFLALYLAIGPSGDCLSIDRWLSKGKDNCGVQKSELATIALRLIQIHLCIVYFFAGAGKLQGDTWWNGTAIWLAVANYEYQTLNLSWMSTQLALVNIVTFGTLFWEVTYPFLIWPKLTRPIWIIMAAVVHLGIGLAMGMLTFGLIMLIGNLAFVPADWVRRFSAAGLERD